MIIVLDTQGIVLRSVKYNDSDLILTIFTRKLGKISVIAKGARRTRSSLLSSCQVFSYSNFTLKKQSNMYKVIQSDSIKNFYNISYDFDALSYASYIVKLVENSIFKGQTNNRLFETLSKALYLYSIKETDKAFITSIFELKLIDYVGYRPIVDRCCICSSKDAIAYKFEVNEGGIVCENCFSRYQEALKIDLTTIKLMQYILNNDIIKCSKAKVSKFILYELDNVLKKYIYVHIGNIDLKSLNILKSVKACKGGFKDGK